MTVDSLLDLFPRTEPAGVEMKKLVSIGFCESEKSSLGRKDVGLGEAAVAVGIGRPDCPSWGSWMTGKDQIAGIVGLNGETTYFDSGLVGLSVRGARGAANWISDGRSRRGDGFLLTWKFSRGKEEIVSRWFLLESATLFKDGFEVEAEALGATEFGLDVCATPPKCPFSIALTPKRYLGSFSLPSWVFSVRGFLASSSSILMCLRSLVLLG